MNYITVHSVWGCVGVDGGGCVCVDGGGCGGGSLVWTLVFFAGMTVLGQT